MKIVTWNVNGLKSAFEKGNFKELLNNDPDIICLQEVKISDEKYLRNIFPEKYYIYYNKAQKNGYSGVAIISKYKPISKLYNIDMERFDSEGRIIILEFSKFTLYNIYFPHGGRDKKNLKYKLEVYDKLTQMFNLALINKKLIIVGDFNIAHEDIDLARPKQNKNNIMFTSEERLKIDRIIELGLVDVFRYFTKEGQNYTWWPYAFNARERNIGWRIDYIFISNFLDKEIEYVKILKNIYGSDHCPMEMLVNIKVS